MILIATTTVNAGGSSEIKFQGIPATFTDLQVVYSVRTGYAATWQQVPIYFNNDSSNTTGRNLYGTGSGTASDTASWPQLAAVANNATANTFSNGSIYIPNYAGSTVKSFSSDVVTENNATAAGQNIFAGLWNSTAAINTVQLWGAGQTFLQYSTASLYGIQKDNGYATVA